MNERTIKLYKEATEFAYQAIGKEHFDKSYFQAAIAGKFAELIVEECIHQVLTGIKCNPPQAEPPEIAKTLARRLQQHFGVKE